MGSLARQTEGKGMSFDSAPLARLDTHAQHDQLDPDIGSLRTRRVPTFDLFLYTFYARVLGLR